jgi:PD-(D/E)XK nuclease superfamily
MTPTPRNGPSPFIDGTCIQFAWDSTCLGAFKKCPRFYQLSVIEGWRRKSDNIHLTFGILYTNALDMYDKLRATGEDHEASLFAVVDNAMTASSGWLSEDTQKNRFTLIRTIIWHLDQYGDNDTAKTLIDENGEALSERSFRWPLDFGPAFDTETMYVLCGHLDRVVSFLGDNYVMDHKTTKTTISDYYFDRYEPDNQMSLYTIAGQVIFHGPIKGVIIDAAQVAVGFSRFARGMTYRTKAQIAEWMEDLGYWLGLAEGYALAQYWPMNDAACFNCQFRGVCSKDPTVRPNFLASDFTKDNAWNPLQVR